MQTPMSEWTSESGKAGYLLLWLLGVPLPLLIVLYLVFN